MANCLRGPFPPVDFRAVCLVQAIANKIGRFSLVIFRNFTLFSRSVIRSVIWYVVRSVIRSGPIRSDPDFVDAVFIVFIIETQKLHLQEDQQKSYPVTYLNSSANRTTAEVVSQRCNRLHQVSEKKKLPKEVIDTHFNGHFELIHKYIPLTSIPKCLLEKAMAPNGISYCKYPYG